MRPLPIPPTFSRSVYGHLLGAVALAALIAAIYAPIAWGMFVGSVDFKAHLAVAQHLYDTGRLAAPHFLFHASVVFLFATHVTSSLLLAGRVIMLCCYVLLGLAVYGLLWTFLKDSRLGWPPVLVLAGLVLLLAQPITLAHAYALGFLWLEAYHNPTSTMLKPFALISFSCTAFYLSRRAGKDARIGGLLALTILAGSLSKPSFIICLLPASLLLLVYRTFRGLPVSTSSLIVGLYVPAAAVLAWQYFETYSGYAPAGMYHDSIVWGPLKFMNYWTNGLVSKFLLSILFPLTVAVLYWKQVFHDALLQLAWLCFFFGAFYGYMLVEKVNWGAGNMLWSAYVTLFTLMFASVVLWLREIASSTARYNSLGWKAYVCGGILLLHAISGARLDWLYLTHYGCGLDFRAVEFVCKG
jgi:hypothetical protein